MRLTDDELQEIRDGIAATDYGDCTISGRLLDELDATRAEMSELKAKLESSLVITPERMARDDDWGKVKRIMWKKGDLDREEVNIVVRCLEDSMYEEVTLADEARKARAERDAAARERDKLRSIVAECLSNNTTK